MSLSLAALGSVLLAKAAIPPMAEHRTQKKACLQKVLLFFSALWLKKDCESMPLTSFFFLFIFVFNYCTNGAGPDRPCILILVKVQRVHLFLVK